MMPIDPSPRAGGRPPRLHAGRARTAAVLAAASAALLCGAAASVQAQTAEPARLHAVVHVDGSGRPATERRSVGSFAAIELQGSMQLILRQAGREALELGGDDNVLPLIEARVVDRAGIATLELGLRRGASVSTRTETTATVDVATLRRLALTGSGDVTGDGLTTLALAIALRGAGDVKLTRLAADDLRIALSGSGDVDVGGRVATLDIAIAGSGDVDTSRLEADAVDVRIAGSGDARVVARRTLAVAIAGSGDVAYSGDARVTSRINGSVSRR